MNTVSNRTYFYFTEIIKKMCLTHFHDQRITCHQYHYLNSMLNRLCCIIVIPKNIVFCIQQVQKITVMIFTGKCFQGLEIHDMIIASNVLFFLVRVRT